jgi:hypothetical protein
VTREERRAREAERQAWVAKHVVLLVALQELLPKEARGDVFDLASLAVRKELPEDALRAAHALGGREALLALVRSGE